MSTKQMDLNLVDQIRRTFSALPNYRKQGNNLDLIAPETLYPLLAEAGDKLYAHGCLEPFINWWHVAGSVG